jgi:hypothetical protein
MLPLFLTRHQILTIQETDRECPSDRSSCCWNPFCNLSRGKRYVFLSRLTGECTQGEADQVNLAYIVEQKHCSRQQGF